MRNPSILIVDDEPQIRRVIKAALSKQGYVVADARSGEAALDMIREERFDMVILDRNMPGIGGLETCRTIRDTSDMGIIMLTVRKAEEERIEALDAGADDYVTKPFSMPELSVQSTPRAFGIPCRRTSGPLRKCERGSGDTSFVGVRNRCSSHTETVRSVGTSYRKPERVNSSCATSPGSLGTGLSRPSRIPARGSQPIAQKD